MSKRDNQEVQQKDNMRTRVDKDGYDLQAKMHKEQVTKTKQGEYGSKQIWLNHSPLGQVDQVKERLNQIQDFNSNPPENFVSQLAFTQLNSFLLTTDGRVFSWGALTSALGREITTHSQFDFVQEFKNQQTQLNEQVDEIIFPRQKKPVTIVKLAAGRSHMIALDAEGRVYTWGQNDFGQLGIGKFQQQTDSQLKFQQLTHVETPTLINSISDKNICQIYAGENQSYAVGKTGEIWCWGNVKNNINWKDDKTKNDSDLSSSQKKLKNQQNQVENDPQVIFAKEKLLYEPKQIKFPFKEEQDMILQSPGNQQVVVNQYQGAKIAIYNSNRMTKSVASKEKIELYECKRMIEKLESQVKQLQRSLWEHSLTDTKAEKLEMDLEKDPIMQNINVLQEIAITQVKKAESQNRKIDAKNSKLNNEIQNFEDQLKELKAKELESTQNIERRGRDKELHEAINALRTTIQKKLTLIRKEQHELNEQFKQHEMTILNMTLTKNMCDNLKKERKRFLQTQYMHQEPNDVEEMVKALHNHFVIIRNTSLDFKTKQNYKGLGTEDLLDQSNRNLIKLQRELEQFFIPPNDLRYELYAMIIQILRDNIELRLQVNKEIKNQIVVNQQRLKLHTDKQRLHNDDDQPKKYKRKYYDDDSSSYSSESQFSSSSGEYMVRNDSSSANDQSLVSMTSSKRV